MTSLAARECNEVLVEAGATLAGAVLEAGLADEIVVYTAPLLLGDSGRGLFHLPRIRRLAEGLELDIVDVCPVGRDWRTTARVRSR